MTQLPHLLQRAVNRIRTGSAAYALLDQGFVSAVNFVVVVMAARVLPLPEFGVFMFAQLLLLLFTTLQNSLVAQPHNILGVQRTGIEFLRLTFVLAALQLALSVAMIAILIAAGAVLTAIGSVYAPIAFALAVIVAPWTMQEFARRVLYTLHDARGAAGNDVITYGAQLLCVALVLLQVGGISANSVNALLAVGVAACLGSICGLYRLRRHIAWREISALPERHSARAFMNTCGESWQLSKWLAAQQGVTWLGSSGHGWILAALLGPASFGLYRAAYQIVSILNPLRQAASNYLPSSAAREFAQHGANGLRQWHTHTAWQLCVPFALLAVLIVACAEPLARLFYGRELTLPNAQTLVALGAASFLLNFLRTPLDYALLAVNGARALFVRACWLAVFVLTAGTLLIWSFGIYGALVSEIVVAVLALLFSMRVYALKLGRRALSSAALASVKA